MNLITYTIDIREIFTNKSGNLLSGRCLCVFAHGLDVCFMVTEPVEDCPVNLLHEITVYGPTTVRHPFLELMKREAISGLIERAKRNAELIPELEALLAQKVAA